MPGRCEGSSTSVTAAASADPLELAARRAASTLGVGSSINVPPVPPAERLHEGVVQRTMEELR